VDLGRVISVADAREAARRRLPRVVFDYIDGGAQDEVTMRANEAAFAGLAWRPRMARPPAAPDLATTVLGTPVSMPVLLAPCGLASLVHPDGVVGAARAARDAGTVTVVSTVAGTPLEDVAARASGPKWFQLYCPGGRDEAAELIDRAAAATYEAIVVTIDTNVLGLRERDAHHGIGQPLKVSPRLAAHILPQLAARPGYLARYARAALAGRSRSGDTPPAPSDAGDAGAGAGADPAAAAGPEAPATPAVPARGGLLPDMQASPFTWDDIAWMRTRWSGPLVVKGLLTGEDAARAVDAGADAVIVSNHGGRQLDGTPSTLAVLPEVVDAVGGRAEVLLDGGVRRGADALKAVALGARAVLVGRPYLYGLAAGGQAGVERVLAILRAEMDHALTLLGCPAATDLDPSWLRPAGPAGG
jgi:L-lactate dehydrogenase (cytochrome)